jgi:hypothetical protein
MNLDRVLNHVRDAFVRQHGRMRWYEFVQVCNKAGATSAQDREIVQATLEATGLRVSRPDVKRRGTDLMFWGGWRETE